MSAENTLAHIIEQPMDSAAIQAREDIIAVRDRELAKARQRIAELEVNQDNLCRANGTFRSHNQELQSANTELQRNIESLNKRNMELVAERDKLRRNLRESMYANAPEYPPIAVMVAEAEEVKRLKAELALANLEADKVAGLREEIKGLREKASNWDAHCRVMKQISEWCGESIHTMSMIQPAYSSPAPCSPHPTPADSVIPGPSSSAGVPGGGA